MHKGKKKKGLERIGTVKSNFSLSSDDDKIFFDGIKKSFRRNPRTRVNKRDDSSNIEEDF